MRLAFLITVMCLWSSVGQTAAQEWKVYKRNHFIIYYQNAPKDFIKSVEESAEDYYNKITRNLGFTRYKGWTWDERAKIYIYDNAKHYHESAVNPQWSSGIASPRSKIIRTFPTSHGFFDSTLPHEMAHIILREFLGPKARVPSWFEEGVAIYQERARRFGAHDQVRAALTAGTFIPLKRLTAMRLTHRTDQATVDLFYAEAASIVNYLIEEHGQHRFTQLCRKLKSGKPFTWAFDLIYVQFKNLDRLNNAWVKYLEHD